MYFIPVFKRILEKIHSIGKIDSEEKKANSLLTGNQLLKEFTDLFTEGLERYSLGGHMVYPMSFHVLMHPVDYDEFVFAFPIVVQEVIKALYGIIDKRKQQFPNYTPLSKNWTFQFTPCYQSNSINTESGDIISVEKGKVIPAAVLCNQNIATTGMIAVSQNIKVSVKCNNSNVIKTAELNLKALAGVNILGAGLYTCKFDPNLTMTPEVIKESTVISENRPKDISRSQGLATLSYNFNGQIITYTMKDSPIYISGKNDLRSSLPIFRMEYSDLENGHVLIKYENNKFFLCAFGKTRLNGRNIALSERDDMNWVPLANNSSILMNDTIQADFTIL